MNKIKNTKKHINLYCNYSLDNNFKPNNILDI